MVERVECYVYNILPSGSGFATRRDNDESVFIASAIVAATKIEPMDLIEALVVPNASNANGRTPWFATRVEVLDEVDDD